MSMYTFLFTELINDTENSAAKKSTVFLIHEKLFIFFLSAPMEEYWNNVVMNLKNKFVSLGSGNAKINKTQCPL